MGEGLNYKYITERRRVPGETRILTDAEAIRTGELVNREREAWQTVLGSNVEVQPLPEYITSEVQQNFQGMGLRLRYIPALNLGNHGYLREKGVEGYLAELHRRYPTWKRPGSLYSRERDDHSISRSLPEWYWQAVEEGEMDFPVLPGQWMAIETVGKPEKGSQYPQTALVSDDRLNISWNDVHKAILRKKRRILSEIGLARRPADLRLLEALEWNLLGNREGWGGGQIRMNGPIQTDFSAMFLLAARMRPPA